MVFVVHFVNFFFILIWFYESLLHTASLAQLVKHVGTEGISDSQKSVQVQIPCSPSYSSKKNHSAILGYIYEVKLIT